MINRCHNPKADRYEYYGGRGIQVCERWRSSFQRFLADMGPRPDGMTLGRIHNDAGYGPKNCRWEDRKAQARNRRSSRIVEYQGERYCLAELSEIYGLKEWTLRRYINRLGSADAALELLRG